MKTRKKIKAYVAIAICIIFFFLGLIFSITKNSDFSKNRKAEVVKSTLDDFIQKEVSERFGEDSEIIFKGNVITCTKEYFIENLKNELSIYENIKILNDKRSKEKIDSIKEILMDYEITSNDILYYIQAIKIKTADGDTLNACAKYDEKLKNCIFEL